MSFPKKSLPPHRPPAPGTRQSASQGRHLAPSAQLKQPAHQPSRPQAPPAYVPRQTPKVAQAKPATPARQQPQPSSQPARAPVAPPAYRPQPAPRVLQMKPAENRQAQKPSTPKAPPVYRPQPPPKVLQTKAATMTQPTAAQAKRAPAAPPVYRPQPTPKVLQRKMACAPQPHANEQSAQPHDPRATRPAPPVAQPLTASRNMMMTPPHAMRQHPPHGATIQRHVAAQGFAHNLAGVIQLAISIGQQRFTHGSKNLMNNLYSQIVLPRLNTAGYKTYGVKSKMVQFVRDGDDHGFTDPNDFWNTFHQWLQNQTRNVRGGKTTPVLKQFTVTGMSRPAWTEDIQQSVGYMRGDNIRHVVRNATLKKALEVEYGKAEKQGLDLKTHFSGLAQTLNITCNNTSSAGDIVNGIYKGLYLNRDNLFAGDAMTNQVIGFAADPVKEFGDDLINMGDQEVNAMQVYGEVMNRLWTAAARVAGKSEFKKQAVRQVVLDIEDVLSESINTLISAAGGSWQVPAEEAGDLIADIGLNFGFDLIDGKVLEDQQDIAQRQYRMIQAETQLQSFILGNSFYGLSDILKVFMGQKQTL